MPISARALAAGTALAIVAVALGAVGPALGQDRPESILPPGFGEPTPAPAPRPTATRSPPASGTVPAPPAPTTGQPPSSATLPPARPSAAGEPLPGEGPLVTPTPVATPTPIDPRVLAEYEMPSFARRSLAAVGPTGTAQGGLAPDAFGRADGRFLEGLMRRLDAPLPSRWLSILLRRALVSRLDTPAGVNGADFAAERAWLLLRMGEAVAARAVVQGVDNANYTPKLYQVAMQAALANADPAALCPLAPGAAQADPERGWTLAAAMCAGLSGNQGAASPLISAARRRHVASGIDLLLAQKVVGAGAQGRQAITIEWDGVDQLTSWRYGLATATGVAVPGELFDTVGRQVRMWRATAPSVALPDRLAAGELAAAQGVLSSAALVDLYGLVDGADDAPGDAAAVARDLRDACASATSAERMTAIRTLWGGGGGAVPYARLVMTARAAARIAPSTENADGARLVAAMLSAGMDRTAARWRDHLPGSGDGWAMLTLADPDARGRADYGALTGYVGEGGTGENGATFKRQLLFAGLAGLGRLSPDDIQRGAQALAVPIGAENGWTRAIDRAARAGEPGTVVLLAAIGMQTASWRGVPPANLYRIVAALRAVGLAGEARMIAAEAIARA